MSSYTSDLGFVISLEGNGCSTRITAEKLSLALVQFHTKN